MKYLLDFLAVQVGENSGGPFADVLTKLTEPPPRVENPGARPEQGTDKTDRTSRVPESSDWPEGWADDFASMVAENRRLGDLPGEAARLAYEALKARAALRLPAPPTWDELSALRWGPAMDADRPWVPAEDDEPGIVIDTPDRGRMLAALRSQSMGGPR